jgi:hypothetical protein
MFTQEGPSEVKIAQGLLEEAIMNAVLRRTSGSLSLEMARPHPEKQLRSRSGRRQVASSPAARTSDAPINSGMFGLLQNQVGCD